jgi:hypothetical protein
MSHFIITTTGRDPEFAGLQLATGYGHVTEEVGFTAEQLLRESERLIDAAHDLIGRQEQRARRAARRRQHEESLALAQLICREGQKYRRHWHDDGTGESGPMGGHVDGYRLGSLTVELSRGDLYIEHGGSCFPTRLDYMAPCNENGRGGGVDFRVRRLMLEAFGRASDRTSLLPKRRRAVLRKPQDHGYGFSGNWFVEWARDQRERKLAEWGAKPWNEGDLVRLVGFDRTGRVASITPERNGTGEPYWWVTVNDDKGQYGCDAAALEPVPEKAAFTVVGLLMYDGRDDSLKGA